MAKYRLGHTILVVRTPNYFHFRRKNTLKIHFWLFWRSEAIVRDDIQYHKVRCPPLFTRIVVVSLWTKTIRHICTHFIHNWMHFENFYFLICHSWSPNFNLNYLSFMFLDISHYDTTTTIYVQPLTKCGWPTHPHVCSRIMWLVYIVISSYIS